MLPPRPGGALVWAHCPDPARVPVITSLADRLAADGEKVTMLVTAPVLAGGVTAGSAAILQPAPPDFLLPVQAFLAHWQPDVMVWTNGGFRPILLAEAFAQPGLAARILIDATASHIGTSEQIWLPGVNRALLRDFDRVLAVNDVAMQRLRRLGVDPQRVELTGALDRIPVVLPCNERERRDLAQTLGSRPVWLAAGVVPDEIAAVIEAHRMASRSAHRLLLILVTASPDMTAGVVEMLREANLSVALRSDDQEPDESIQVFVADNLAEMGLWYRLAPIAFIGGTLRAEGSNRHPYEAATLGSAVLHGTYTGTNATDYQRLARAGASRTVRTGAELGQAVEALLSPEKAAAMAHAAWDVTTSGADVGNRVIELIRQSLDGQDL